MAKKKVSNDEVFRMVLRHKYRNSKLTKEQISRIESIPEWDWFPRENYLSKMLKLAEERAADNGGVLKKVGWYRNNGYRNLGDALVKYPDLFSHISQEPKRRTPEENVRIAEGLAKSNSGELQHKEWLYKNGYRGVVESIRLHPHLFNHIKQVSMKGSSSSTHIETANVLAKNNGGSLQSISWLLNNGYGGLAKAINIKPELFSHLKREFKNKKPEDHVPTAEQLAKDNKGRLPTRSWLLNNGFLAVSQAMTKRPELFVHIPREFSRKTREEWIPIAKQLIKDNNGTLPMPSWLIKNGYIGLYKTMKKRPDLFRFAKKKTK